MSLFSKSIKLLMPYSCCNNNVIVCILDFKLRSLPNDLAPFLEEGLILAPIAISAINSRIRQALASVTPSSKQPFLFQELYAFLVLIRIKSRHITSPRITCQAHFKIIVVEERIFSRRQTVI